MPGKYEIFPTKEIQRKISWMNVQIVLLVASLFVVLILVALV